MKYLIEYSTENNYDESTQVFLVYLIIPEENAYQKVVSFDITTEPSAPYSINTNAYHFKTITFSKLPRLGSFKLNLKLEIEKIKLPKLNYSSFSIEKEREVLNSFGYKKSNYFNLTQTNFTRLPKSFTDKLKLKSTQSCFAYCSEINKHVYHMLNYQVGATTVDTTAEMALEIQKGVCQDFSHIFLGIVREQQIAARYVSGYLYINHELEAQLHAWVEVMIPNLGWVGFDPTNNLLVNEKYFKIAHGVDYSECSSVKGLVVGSVQNSTNYHVIIQHQQQQQ